MSDTEKELREMCEYIRDRMEAFAYGYLYDTEEGEMIRPEDLADPDYNEERYQTLSQYFDDNYGVEITKTIGYSDDEFSSCSICVATGGPGIYIDTASRCVEGRWWGTNVDVGLSDKAVNAINDAVRYMVGYY